MKIKVWYNDELRADTDASIKETVCMTEAAYDDAKENPDLVVKIEIGGRV